MNSHDRVMEAMRNFRHPVTAPIVQGEITPKPPYAIVLSCLNDLVRQGKLTESRNTVDKRVFQLKEK